MFLLLQYNINHKKKSGDLWENLRSRMKLDDVAYDIRGPVLEEAMRMRANGEQILGWIPEILLVGFTAPDEVIRDLIHNARKSEGYSDSREFSQLVRRLCNLSTQGISKCWYWWYLSW